MGIVTATVEMRSPEEHRERLHDRVKAASTVMVLLHGPGPRGDIDGRPMALVRTTDDTTMYLATSLDASRTDELARHPRVMVVVSSNGYALLSAEVRISRDRSLIDELWSETWKRWVRGKSDRSLAILILSPIEGSYWEDAEQHSYLYRLVDN